LYVVAVYMGVVCVVVVTDVGGGVASVAV